MGSLLTQWSAEQDRTGDPALVRQVLDASRAAAWCVYGLTVTFAMVDWTMSVNPHWFSTMWGLLYMVGQGAVGAWRSRSSMLIMLSQIAPLNRVVTPHHLHDLGKLLFAFLMLWAYLSFSQFLIIWSANLVEEIPHYLDAMGRRLAVGQRVHHRRCTSRCPTRCCCRATSSATARRLRVIATVDPVRAHRRLLLARGAGVPQRAA